MKHLDANVLIAWHRADHPHHGPVKQWCNELLDADEPFGAVDLVWVAFVRVCSNSRVFPVPTPTATLFDFKHSIEEQRNHLPVVPGERHWEIVERLCRRHRISGNLVNDAFLAGVAIEHGAGFVSLDGDFGRFRELRWIDPLNQ